MEKQMASSKKKSKLLPIIIGIAFILLFQFIPAPEGLNHISMKVIGIFIGAMILWLTVSIDWPSLLAIAALVFVGIMEPNDIYASFFGNSTILFLAFSYMMAHCLTESGVLKRVAIWFITRKITHSHPWALVLMLAAAGLLVSLVILPSTMILIFLPIMAAIFEQCEMKPGNKVAELVVLLVSFIGCTAQGMTPIGHAHPVIAMTVLEGATGYAMSYSDFMLFAIPIGLVIIVLTILYFKFVVKLDVSPLAAADTEQLKAELGPMGAKEKITSVIFILVILCWLAPAIFQPINKDIAAFFSKQVGTVIPPMVAVVIMCIINVDGKPLCNFKEATSKGVPWGMCFLVGSTVVLSSCLTNEATGVTAWIGKMLGSVSANMSPIVIILFFAAFAVIMTNFTSNAVTATLVTTIMLTVVLAIPESVNPYAMTAVIASGVNNAFATPLATATITIIAGSGWVTTKETFKHGAIVAIIAIAVFVLLGYPLANSIMPYVG